MLNSYFNLTGISEWCAFLASLLFLDKKAGLWRFFKVFLFITILAETLGWYSHYFLNKGNNYIFNILLLITVSFFIWMFVNETLMQIIRRRLFITLIFFIFFALVNLLFIEGFQSYNGYSEVIGDIILTSVSCNFLFLILRDDEYINIFRYEYFWLASGLLFYCLGSIVLYLFLDSLRTFTKETGIPVYLYLNGGLNIIFYSCLIIAFICKYRATK